MAISQRDDIYAREAAREQHRSENRGTGVFVGIIVAFALVAIGYLVFSANSTPTNPAAPVTINTAPAMESAPALDVAPSETAPVTTDNPGGVVPEASPAAEPAAPGL